MLTSNLNACNCDCVSRVGSMFNIFIATSPCQFPLIKENNGTLSSQSPTKKLLTKKVWCQCCHNHSPVHSTKSSSTNWTFSVYVYVFKWNVPLFQRHWYLSKRRRVDCCFQLPVDFSLWNENGLIFEVSLHCISFAVFRSGQVDKPASNQNTYTVDSLPTLSVRVISTFRRIHSVQQSSLLCWATLSI